MSTSKSTPSTLSGPFVPALLVGLALGITPMMACTEAEQDVDVSDEVELRNAPAELEPVLIVQLSHDDPSGVLLAQHPALQPIYQAEGAPQAVLSHFSGIGRTRAELEAWVTQVRAAHPLRSGRSVVAELDDQEFLAEVPDLQRYYRLRFAPGTNMQAIAAQLGPLPFVTSARTVQRWAPAPWPEEPWQEPEQEGECSPNDPEFCAGNQPHLNTTRVTDAWADETGDPGVLVAVLDNGFDLNHPDLVSRWAVNHADPIDGLDNDGNGYIDDYRGWNAMSGGVMSTIGDHGTKVAGIIGADTDNHIGVAGTMWAGQMLPVRISGATMADAITFAVARGSDVINMSWAQNNRSQDVEDAVHLGYLLGVVSVHSAGNDARETFGGSASAEQITVGGSATDLNYGVSVDVHAPSWVQTSTAAGGGYGGICCTSAAAPQVSGIAGLLLAADPTLTVEELRQALRTTASDLGTPGWDAIMSYGQVDALAALASVTALSGPVVSTASKCEAHFTSPELYSIERSGAIDLRGYVGGSGMRDYVLAVHEGMPGGPMPLVDFKADMTPVRGGTLLSTSLSPGPHTAVLQVVDHFGNICGEDRVMFNVSPQSAPVVELEDPGLAYGTGDMGRYSGLTAGDIDGDGVDDLLVSHNRCDTLRCKLDLSSVVSRSATIRLVYGGASVTASGTYDVASDGVSWKQWNAEGVGVASAIADVDADGYGDVVLGYPAAPDASTGTTLPGRVCVFLGSNRGSWGLNMAASSADYCFEGEADGDKFGAAVRNGGDLDDDGSDDIVVSACGNDDAGTDFGKVYVLNSSGSSSWSSSTALSAVTSLTELTLASDTGYHCDDRFGELISIDGAGDIDGDGVDDLVVGNRYHDNFLHPVKSGMRDYLTRGEAHLFYGSNSTISSGAAASVADVTIASTDDYAYNVGERVRGVGDINGDGYDDLAISFCNTGFASIVNQFFFDDCDGSGGVYLVYGDASLSSSMVASTDADVTLSDVDAMDRLGWEMVGDMDLDGDGIDDLLLSAPQYGGYDYNGMVWVLYGDAAGHTSGSIRAVADDVLRTAEDQLSSTYYRYRLFYGASLAAGDFDGDGDPDVVVGMPGAEDYYRAGSGQASAWLFDL